MAAGSVRQAVQLPSGKENTTVIVQNAGSANATWQWTSTRPPGYSYPRPAGPSPAYPQEVRARSTGQQRRPSGGVPGRRVVSSDQKVNALTVRDILDGDSKSYSIASAGANGAQKLAIPIAFNELLTADWNSRIAVVNTGSTISCIKVTYFLVPNVGGSATTSQTITDLPSGQPGAPPLRGSVGGQVTFGRAGTGVTQFPSTTQKTRWRQIEVVNPGGGNIAANVDIYAQTATGCSVRTKDSPSTALPGD